MMERSFDQAQSLAEIVEALKDAPEGVKGLGGLQHALHANLARLNGEIESELAQIAESDPQGYRLIISLAMSRVGNQTINATEDRRQQDAAAATPVLASKKQMQAGAGANADGINFLGDFDLGADAVRRVQASTGKDLSKVPVKLNEGLKTQGINAVSNAGGTIEGTREALNNPDILMEEMGHHIQQGGGLSAKASIITNRAQAEGEAARFVQAMKSNQSPSLSPVRDLNRLFNDGTTPESTETTAIPTEFSGKGFSVEGHSVTVQLAWINSVASTKVNPDATDEKVSDAAVVKPIIEAVLANVMPWVNLGQSPYDLAYTTSEWYITVNGKDAEQTLPIEMEDLRHTFGPDPKTPIMWTVAPAFNVEAKLLISNPENEPSGRDSGIKAEVSEGEIVLHTDTKRRVLEALQNQAEHSALKFTPDEITTLAENVTIAFTRNSGMGLSNVFSHEEMRKLVGKEAWDRYISNTIVGEGGLLFRGDIKDPAEQQKAVDFLSSLGIMPKPGSASNQAGKATPPITPALMMEWERLQNEHPEILEKLKSRSSGSTGSKAVDLFSLTSIDNFINDFKLNEVAQKIDPSRSTDGNDAGKTSNNIQQGKIRTLSAPLKHDTEASFVFERDNNLQHFDGVPFVEIEWKVRRIDSDGYTPVTHETVSYNELDGATPLKVKLPKYEKGPLSGGDPPRYQVLAIVKHSAFRTAGFEEVFEVTSIKDQVHTTEAEAYRGLLTPQSAQSLASRDVLLKGPDEVETFNLEMDPQFTGLTIEQRIAFLRERIQRLRGAHFNVTDPVVRDSLTRVIDNHMRVLERLALQQAESEDKRGRSIEIRGTLVSEKSDVGDTQLRLHAFVSFEQPSAWRIEVIDSSPFHGPSPKVFEVQHNGDFDGLISSLAEDMVDAYPKGVVSIAVEKVDAELASTKQVIVKRLQTTLLKDINELAYSPAAQLTVNTVLTVAMAVAPASIPIALPLLATYDAGGTVIDWHTKSRTGELETSKAMLDLTQLTLGLIPALKAMKPVTSGQTHLGLVVLRDLIDTGAGAVVLTDDISREIKRATDQHVPALMELMQQHQAAVEAYGPESHQAIELQQQIDQKAKAFDAEWGKVTTEFTKNFAVLALGPPAVASIARRAVVGGPGTVPTTPQGMTASHALAVTKHANSVNELAGSGTLRVGKPLTGPNAELLGRALLDGIQEGNVDILKRVGINEQLPESVSETMSWGLAEIDGTVVLVRGPAEGISWTSLEPLNKVAEVRAKRRTTAADGTNVDASLLTNADEAVRSALDPKERDIRIVVDPGLGDAEVRVHYDPSITPPSRDSIYLRVGPNPNPTILQEHNWVIGRLRFMSTRLGRFLQALCILRLDTRGDELKLEITKVQGIIKALQDELRNHQGHSLTEYGQGKEAEIEALISHYENELATLREQLQDKGIAYDEKKGFIAAPPKPLPKKAIGDDDVNDLLNNLSYQKHKLTDKLDNDGTTEIHQSIPDTGNMHAVPDRMMDPNDFYQVKQKSKITGYIFALTTPRGHSVFAYFDKIELFGGKSGNAFSRRAYYGRIAEEIDGVGPPYPGHYWTYDEELNDWRLEEGSPGATHQVALDSSDNPIVDKNGHYTFELRVASGSAQYIAQKRDEYDVKHIANAHVWVAKTMCDTTNETKIEIPHPSGSGTKKVALTASLHPYADLLGLSTDDVAALVKEKCFKKGIYKWGAIRHALKNHFKSEIYGLLGITGEGKLVDIENRPTRDTSITTLLKVKTRLNSKDQGNITELWDQAWNMDASANIAREPIIFGGANSITFEGTTTNTIKPDHVIAHSPLEVEKSSDWTPVTLNDTKSGKHGSDIKLDQIRNLLLIHGENITIRHKHKKGKVNYQVFVEKQTITFVDPTAFVTPGGNKMNKPFKDMFSLIDGEPDFSVIIHNNSGQRLIIKSNRMEDVVNDVSIQNSIIGWLGGGPVPNGFTAL